MARIAPLRWRHAACYPAWDLRSDVARVGSDVRACSRYLDLHAAKRSIFRARAEVSLRRFRSKGQQVIAVEIIGKTRQSGGGVCIGSCFAAGSFGQRAQTRAEELEQHQRAVRRV